MNHAIPFALKGENVQTAAPVTQAVPLAPTVAPAAPSTPKPTFARAAGDERSWAEMRLLDVTYRATGLAACYNAIPHRSKAAVRGRLQRAGLVLPRRSAP